MFDWTIENLVDNLYKTSTIYDIDKISINSLKLCYGLKSNVNEYN